MKIKPLKLKGKYRKWNHRLVFKENINSKKYIGSRDLDKRFVIFKEI
jgi:hypothetical protein